MSRDIFADVCAYFPPGTKGEKAVYRKIGVALKDSENGRIAIRLDTLPIAGTGWEGWLNLFDVAKKVAKPVECDFDDDIPF